MNEQAYIDKVKGHKDMLHTWKETNKGDIGVTPEGNPFLSGGSMMHFIWWKAKGSLVPPLYMAAMALAGLLYGVFVVFLIFLIADLIMPAEARAEFYVSQDVALKSKLRVQYAPKDAVVGPKFCPIARLQVPEPTFPGSRWLVTFSGQVSNNSSPSKDGEVANPLVTHDIRVHDGFVATTCLSHDEMRAESTSVGIKMGINVLREIHHLPVVRHDVVLWGDQGYVDPWVVVWVKTASRKNWSPKPSLMIDSVHLVVTDL